MTDLALERFTSADLAGLLGVTASSGWLHTADDWGAVLHCLELRPAGAPVVLIATPFGLPLYVQLGFKTVAHIRRLTSTGSSRAPSGPQRELPPAPRGL